MPCSQCPSFYHFQFNSFFSHSFLPNYTFRHSPSMPDIYRSAIRLRLCTTQYTFRVSRAERRWPQGHASLAFSFELSLSLDSRSRQIMYIIATFNINFLGDPLFLLFCVLFLLSTPIEGPRTLTRASRQIESPCHRVRLVLWSNSFYLPSRSHICFTSAPLSRTTVGVLWTKAGMLYINKH